MEGPANSSHNSPADDPAQHAPGAQPDTIAALKFENIRFQNAYKATQDVIWDWNLINNTVWWNDQFQATFVYSPDQVRNTIDFWYDLIHPEDRQRIVDGIHNAIASGDSFWSGEYRFRKGDGSYAVIQDRGFVQFNSEKAPTRMVGSMRDVTKARQDEEQLRMKEERLRLAVESASVGTWDFDIRTGVLDWDNRVKELFGLSPTAHVDYNVFLQGLHPDDRARVDKINRDAMADGSHGLYDTEYRTIGIEDNKLRWVRARGRTYFDANGRAQRYIGTVLDITPQKKQEQELADQVGLFQLLITSIPQIVWTTDPQGAVTYISDRLETYTGMPVTEGAPDFSDLIHPDDVARVLANWQTSIHTGQPWLGEYRLIDRRTQQYRWFSAAVIPLKDTRGTVTKWIGSAADVHDQKLVEQDLERRIQDRTDKLQETNLRLQQSNRELEQFAFVASHDLQEPLRKISTYLDFLKPHVSMADPKVASYFEKIERSTTRMRSLIRNLLDYSKLSKEELVFEDVDLGKIVADVLADFEVALTQKSIMVTVGPLPTVRGVAHQMNQLFHNLVGNAVKFAKPETEGFIRITSTDEPAGQAIAPHYKISVADTGVGFNQAYAHRMFEIFQRLPTEKKVSGHGIGLAICQKIVDNHNGVLSAQGVEGQGATFFIDLPH